MADDQRDVLGSLPRSRPGRRSAKRSQPAATPAQPAATPAQPAARPAQPAARRSQGGAQRVPRRPAPGPAERAPQPHGGGGAVADALEAAAMVAEAGVRVWAGAARELLRRIPRP